ncbi:6-carboxytetrahydropterin synthase [Gammaproteobacteria bacterium]|nr:6-carboxytetrahydropterin synthase [Gammaproteobacteria bacterium]
MFSLTIQSGFCAARHLPLIKGPCANPHGHTFEVTAKFKSSQLNDDIVIDYNQLKTIVDRFVHKFDHKDLNQLDAFKDFQPSNERILMVIFEQISGALPTNSPKLDSLKIQDQAGICLKYQPE